MGDALLDDGFLFRDRYLFAGEFWQHSASGRVGLFDDRHHLRLHVAIPQRRAGAHASAVQSQQDNGDANIFLPVHAAAWERTRSVWAMKLTPSGSH